VIQDLSISEAVLLFGLRLVVPLFSPIGEEPGWRGFALPRLLDGRSPLSATVILAPLVALWHAPLIFIESEDLPPIFLLATAAVTFFYTWLFVHTGGSVFITILAHAAEGLIGRELIGSEGWSGSDETHWVVLYTAAWCALAIVLLAFDWQFWRTRTPSTSGAVYGHLVRSDDPPRVRAGDPLEVVGA
jgi:membrane protease YdiL (CAAX protease family)